MCGTLKTFQIDTTFSILFVPRSSTIVCKLGEFIVKANAYFTIYLPVYYTCTYILHVHTDVVSYFCHLSSCTFLFVSSIHVICIFLLLFKGKKYRNEDETCFHDEN